MNEDNSNTLKPISILLFCLLLIGIYCCIINFVSSEETEPFNCQDTIQESSFLNTFQELYLIYNEETGHIMWNEAPGCDNYKYEIYINDKLIDTVYGNIYCIKRHLLSGSNEVTVKHMTLGEDPKLYLSTKTVFLSVPINQCIELIINNEFMKEVILLYDITPPNVNTYRLYEAKNNNFMKYNLRLDLFTSVDDNYEAYNSYRNGHIQLYMYDYNFYNNNFENSREYKVTSTASHNIKWNHNSHLQIDHRQISFEFNNNYSHLNELDDRWNGTYIIKGFKWSD